MFNKWLLTLVSCAFGATAQAGESCSATSGNDFKPLVELYTSEGCSSCPPADRWLSTQTNRSDINLLAFHVDYWDSIGWPDRFASPEYSRRQRQRVHAAEGRSVYTPQVMVGGNVSVTWRSPGSFKSALQSNSPTHPASLKVSLERDESQGQVTLSAASNGLSETPSQVWLAQYVDAKTTEVRAGENRGETLRHDRVVQNFWGPWPLAGGLESQVQTINIPEGAWGLVAFVEDRAGNTLQSLALPSSHCK